MKSKLSHREQKVLWATINHYIATAEPVGSKVLVEEYNFDISAATIRNVMNMLDRSGLLYQPHTSAGRVPSDSGYRVYVDELIHPTLELTNSTTKLLSQKLDLSSNLSLEALLRSVTQVLAAFTGCIALITAPNLQPTRIRHIQLVRVETHKIMVVAVSDSYHTASVLMELPPETEADVLELELQIINNFLNTHLRDRNLTDLSNLNWDELDRDFKQYATLLEQSFQQLNRACNPPALGQIFISGLTELLRQPEFNQLSQVQAIVQLLEEDQALLFPLIFEVPDAQNPNRVKIRIGSELSLEPIQHCTLISSIYDCDDVPVGSVGLLGPTRLSYERAIASVQAVAAHLSETLSQR